MKKALLVTRVSGFVPQHEMNNVKILQQMGYEVHYATDLNNVVYGKDNSRLEGTGIITHQIDFVKSPFSPAVKKSYRQLVELMEQESFDLIHCHMPMSAVVGRLAANAVRKKTGRKVPVLYTAHGFHFYSGAPWKNWLYYPVERYLARYTDRLIVINGEDYERAGHFPIRGKVVYVPGVGAKLQSAGKKKDSVWKRDLRQEFGLSEDTKLLVSVGELSARKNNSLVVRAMAEVKDLDLVYIVCGSGDREESLRQQVQDLQLERKVFFAGYVNEVSEVLCQADAFVLPSYQEGLPVAVMEAMTCGLPVIASDIRGVRDLIEHGKGGYLVQGFDPVDYAVKIRRLFTEKQGEKAIPRAQRRQQMGEWNKKRVQAFSLEVVATKMREIYQEIEEERQIDDTTK